MATIEQAERLARQGPTSGTATHWIGVWINQWASIYEEFEEGGFKQSGRGRLRGQAGLDDFLECKHIAFRPGTIER